MAKYTKKLKNGRTYYFKRLYYGNGQTKDLYGKTTKELTNKIKAFQEKINKGISDDSISFDIFFKKWLDTVHYIGKKASTIERYDSIYRNYIKNSAIAETPLSKLSTETFQNYYNNLYQTKNSASCVKQVHKLIKPCLRYAYQTGYTLRDYSIALKLPRESFEILLSRKNKADVRPLTIEEHQQFLKTIHGDPLEALYVTALDTGARQGELLALTWDDINFETRELNINKSFKRVKNITTKRYHPIVETPKNVTSIRKVPIPQKTSALLQRHKENQANFFKSIGLNQTGNSLVFCTVVGSYLDSQNIRKKLLKHYNKIGVKDKCFHDLRHTYATRLFEFNEDPKVVQSLLGHSNRNTTLNTYVHVLDDLKQKAASKLDQFYDQTLEY